MVVSHSLIAAEDDLPSATFVPSGKLAQVNPVARMAASRAKIVWEKGCCWSCVGINRNLKNELIYLLILRMFYMQVLVLTFVRRGHFMGHKRLGYLCFYALLPGGSDVGSPPLSVAFSNVFWFLIPGVYPGPYGPVVVHPSMAECATKHLVDWSPGRDRGVADEGHVAGVDGAGDGVRVGPRVPRLQAQQGGEWERGSDWLATEDDVEPA